MEITHVESFLIDPFDSNNQKSGGLGVKNLLFLKVTTDEGICGWGEAFTMPDRERSINQYIKELTPYVLGRDPFKIKDFTQMVYNDFASRRGSMDLFCAISGIEQALWDIVGKSLNTPVYNLLGGLCRNKIKVYANGWYQDTYTIDEIVKSAKEVIKSGFNALKIYPFPRPFRLFIDKKEESIAVERVRALREAVGPKVDILIDVCRGVAPMYAIRVAKLIKEFDPFWYEEPGQSVNLDILAEIRNKIDIPIAIGECLYTKLEFREALEKHVADFLMPDVGNCGGILELKEIAAMAEPYSIAIAPHNYNSTTIGLAATLQVAATIPNFLITEYYVGFSNFGNEISINPFNIKNGYIDIPNSPGLGIEINEELLQKYSFREFPKRKFRSFKDEGS